MSNIYAFVFAGIVGAAVALYIWLKDEETPQRQNSQKRPSRPPDSNPSTSRETGDVSPPRYFDTDSNCIICCDRQCSVKFVPCLHSCMCDNCVEVYLKYDRKCPLCRSTIERSITAVL